MSYKFQAGIIYETGASYWVVGFTEKMEAVMVYTFSVMAQALESLQSVPLTLQMGTCGQR